MDAWGAERKPICVQLKSFPIEVIPMMSAGRRLIRFKGVPLMLAVVALLAGCGSGGSGNSAPPVTMPQAATPVLSVSAGTYTALQSVAITDSTSGAAIYYTTNGAAPTTSSAAYSAPIPISTTTTIEALAVASGYTNSSVSSATYTHQPSSGPGDFPDCGHPPGIHLPDRD